MSQPIFALIDCNNFFVSCLRVFQPQLEGKPVVALSSNDGCVVARSNEARALNIPMGAPAFKWKQFFKDNGVIQMSGNFDLYGDMSRRITSILTTITPHIEIYSVDESFLDLSELLIDDFEQWGSEVRKRILQWTGIPVSIGIAPSKTLAKLGAERAKKIPELNGVLDLITKPNDAYLQQTPVQDVWGVGRRLGPRLRAESILTALDLKHMNPRLAQQSMGIQGRQVVAELNGSSCWPLELHHKPAKSIAVTRTFGQDTDIFNVIESALTTFASKASYRLRQSKQLTRQLGFFMTTSRHKPGYIAQSASLRLPTPTADTGILIEAAVRLANAHFRRGRLYHRAGIWLYDFVPADSFQLDLLASNNAQQVEAQRMQAVDSLNATYGRNTIRYASEDIAKDWQPRKEIRTPRYTTRWDELPKIRSSQGSKKAHKSVS